MDRNELRSALLDKRSRLAAIDIERASAAVARQVIDLPAVAAATRIAAYRAVRGELACDPVVRWAWDRRCRVYLPVTRPPREMSFARWRQGDSFAQSRFGIDEPLPTARRVAVGRIDV